MINQPTNHARDPALTRLPLGQNRHGVAPEHDRALQHLDEVTLAAAKSAKDYRSRMLENVKVNINAALDYANGLASASGPHDPAGEVAGQGREQTSGAPVLERPAPTLADAAEDYRAKAFELMTANVNATLEYARLLASVKSPAEFVELTTDHARKHFELIMTHAAALGALSRSLTTRQPDE